jgi:lipoprotein-releasing system permease protein
MRNSWPILFALRYFRGKRAGNAVPILSRISIAAITIASAAMVVIFSVFNGFEFLLKDMYKAFYPELKITASAGKFFALSDVPLAAIERMDGVQYITCTIEDNALATDMDDVNGSAKKQKVVVVKGVTNTYFKVNSLSSFLDTDDSVSETPVATALIGNLVARELGVNTNNDFQSVFLYYPNPSVTNPEVDPINAFNSLRLKPTSLFFVGDEFDEKYVLAPLRKVQQLLHAEGKASSIELSTRSGASEQVQAKLQVLLGNKFKVATRYQQNPTVYMMMQAEKLVIFIIFIFILFIASFNMIGALLTIVLEKKKDIAILTAMGALPTAIRNVFVAEGVLWGLVGGLAGIGLGTMICVAQQRFGLVRLPGSFVTEIFPVVISFVDVISVLVATVVVSFLAAWLPASKAVRVADPSLKSN